jgi:hypothetical protein
MLDSPIHTLCKGYCNFFMETSEDMVGECEFIAQILGKSFGPLIPEIEVLLDSLTCPRCSLPPAVSTPSPMIL